MNSDVNDHKEGIQWRQIDFKSGHRTIVCDNWNGFVEFMNNELSKFNKYIYRGHASEDWKLNTTLDRHLDNKGIDPANYEKLINTHLTKFKNSTRGRITGNRPNTDLEWWALGQHNGLFTPLLDWTESPYIAAYFAFSAKEQDMTGEFCVIFCLSTVFVDMNNTISEISKNLSESDISNSEPQNDVHVKRIELVSSESADNSRLVSQRGLLTYTHPGTDLMDLIKQKSTQSTRGVLIEIRVPKSEREHALINLNRMNINHLSLFPDLYGASKFCNMHLVIDRY